MYKDINIYSNISVYKIQICKYIDLLIYNV